jgi:hypothetical protein
MDGRTYAMTDTFSAEPPLIGPSDDGWDAARTPWNLAVDQRPALIAQPTSVEEVVGAVRLARQRGLRIAAQSTGHGAAALGGLAGTLLVRTGGLRGVEIDAAARRARVAAGSQWADVLVPAAAVGLTPVCGFAPGVGVAGFCLGGGLGWLARRHGLGSESVLAVELVTADGEVVRADRDTEPDLFWALRGGGGSFGVVTAFELELQPVETLYAGMLLWPWERAGAVLEAWRGWVGTVPEELTSVGRILQVPDLPMAPPPLRGRSFVVVEAAFLGDADAGAALLDPLRELGPEMDTFAMVSPAALGALHADPEDPMPALTEHTLLRGLDSAAIDAFVSATGAASGSIVTSVELRHLGGALSRRSPGAGALGAIDGEFSLFGVGVPMTPEMGQALAGQLGAIRDTMAPWRAARQVLNFVEHPTDGRVGFDDDTYRRLQDVRRRYDRDGVLLASHGIAVD